MNNIDGNNRINAIYDFINKPFSIYPEYLSNFKKFVNDIEELQNEQKDRLINHFENIMYTDIVKIGRLKLYFGKTDINDIYVNCLSKNGYNDNLDEIIEDIQHKLKIDDSSCLDKIKINVDIFENYSVTELSNLFEDINKYDSKLTASELLACKLYNLEDFKINNNVLNQSIINKVKEYYKDNKEDEALQCYDFTEYDIMNAYDFIVGFQNYCHSEFDEIIGNFNRKGLSLFFKLYECLYSLDNSFNTVNINCFIDYIQTSCIILKEIFTELFTDQIDDKLFSKSYSKQRTSLSKNNLFIIMIMIIGKIKKNQEEEHIKNILNRQVLFHFFIKNLNKEDKANYKQFDIIRYEGGSSELSALTKNALENPNIFDEKITKNLMEEVLNKIINKKHKPKKRYLENGNKGQR